MCCCCGCCGKILKLVCSIIWIAIALAIIACIIIFAIAWGGSKVMQDVVDKLVKHEGGLESFGAYIANDVAAEGSPMPECVDLAETEGDDERRFGWKIDFNTKEKMGLGVYARLSNKGIKDQVENVMVLRGLFDMMEGDERQVFIDIPVNIYDENGEEVEDEKKQYIIHDRYMRLDAYGHCADECPEPDENNMYKLKISEAEVHLRISFKSVPDFINLPFDGKLDYEGFVNFIYKVVKVFDKSAAKSVKESMTGLTTRVTEFGPNDMYCPLSPAFNGVVEEN